MKVTEDTELIQYVIEEWATEHTTIFWLYKENIGTFVLQDYYGLSNRICLCLGLELIYEFSDYTEVSYVDVDNELIVMK